MEIKTTTKYRPLIGFGDKYRVYPCGTIYRKATESSLPNGSIRKLPKKKLKPQFISRRGGGKTNKLAVMLSDDSGKQYKIPVSTCVAFAWKNAFDYDFQRYPELIFLDDDWSNHKLSNLRIHIPWTKDTPDPVWDFDQSRFYYYEYSDGTKLHCQSVFAKTKSNRTLFNIENRIHSNAEESLLYRMCLKADEVGTPKVVIQDANPHNAIGMEDCIKVCMHLNQEEGWPLHPMAEGSRARTKITL